VVLPLEAGFETDNLAVISETDILGDRLARPRRKRRASNFLAEASSLTQGDLVVHIDHGIGRYAGLKTLEVQGRRTTVWNYTTAVKRNYICRLKTLIC